MVTRAQHLAGYIPQVAELMNSRTRREILLKLTITITELAYISLSPAKRSQSPELSCPPRGVSFWLARSPDSIPPRSFFFAKVPPASSGAQEKVGARFLGCPQGLKNGLMVIGSWLPSSRGD